MTRRENRDRLPRLPDRRDPDESIALIVIGAAITVAALAWWLSGG